MIQTEGPRGLFLQREIEVLTADGPKRILALTYREFAVAHHGGFFEIFHIPSALSFCSAGACFAREDVACRAAIRIDRLRNEWSRVSLDELMALQKPIVDICKGFGGKPPAAWLADRTMVNEHNGYSAALN